MAYLSTSIIRSTLLKALDEYEQEHARGATARDLADRLDVNTSKFSKVLFAYATSGFMRKEKIGSSSYYFITDVGRNVLQAQPTTFKHNKLLAWIDGTVDGNGRPVTNQKRKSPNPQSHNKPDVIPHNPPPPPPPPRVYLGDQASNVNDSKQSNVFTNSSMAAIESITNLVDQNEKLLSFVRDLHKLTKNILDEHNEQ